MRADAGKSNADTVDLRREDEVILRQSIDLVRPDLDNDPSPGQVEVGMVPLRFGKLADAIDEDKRGLPVLEIELFAEVMLFYDVPSIDLGQQRSEITRSERRDLTLAWNTAFCSQLGHAR